MNRRAAIRRIGGVGAALFVGACSKAERILGVDVLQKDAPGRPANVVASHTVFITVEDNSIQVAPETLRMNKRDQMQWVATNGRGFSILFGGDTPFSSRELAYAEATAAQHPLVKGRFKYTIVSDENPQLQLDPVIVVDEPPSTGTT